jgi:hypothetical protein
MAVGGCRSVDAMHSKGGYRKPIIETTSILDHKDGHYVMPNREFSNILISKMMLIKMLM